MMQRQGLTLVSPAKVNLFLRVTERRTDGYHNLASLFQAIDLVDVLHIRLSDSNVITCNTTTVPLDRSNLIVKAVELFSARTGIQTYVNIHLDKRIPVQAGLGGGSSNAATTLWALNDLHGKPVSMPQLMAYALELGSDVPFFLSQGSAYCTGRGEVLEHLTPLPKQKLWIVKPPEGLPTADVFRRVNVDALPKRDPKVSLKAWLGGKPMLFNDLEVAAFDIMPDLEALKENLRRSGFADVVMSGSGTAFACFGEGEPPFLPGLELYPASFLNRRADSWYQL